LREGAHLRDTKIKQKNMKKFLVFLLIIVFGIFIYLKFLAAGDPNSSFNQTTRYSLAKYPIMRTILGLHRAGDARAEFFQYTLAPIVVEWFKPTGQDIDPSLLDQFAQDLGKYTKRPAQVIYGGNVSDGTLKLGTLAAFELKANAQKPLGATVLPVFFTEDYFPRPAKELATGYEEWGVVISLSAHRNYFGNGQSLEQNLFPSLLRGFGHQIGLKENNDPNCIMYVRTAEAPEYQNFIGSSLPQDFCPQEQKQIEALKLRS
jgi:hypothetical protein